MEGTFAPRSAAAVTIDTPDALTDAVGGAYGASVGGNRLVVGLAEAAKISSTDLGIDASESNVRFALGVAIAAATGDTVEGAQGILYQWYSATVERVEVITGCPSPNSSWTEGPGRSG